MKQMFRWFFLSCKRYLKKASFLLILLVFPAAAGLFLGSEKRDDEGIVIGVFSPEEEESLGGRLVKRLKEYGDGMFSFQVCASEEEVSQAVASRRAECGYVLPEDLEKRLDEGTYKRSIRVYRAPSTVADAMASEVVYSLLAQEYDRKILTDYVETDEIFNFLDVDSDRTRQEAAERAGTLYDAYSSNGSTFQFSYQEDGKNDWEADLQDGGTSTIFPVRGLAAVLVFTAGIYGAAVLKEDEACGLFLRLPFRIRGLCKSAGLGAPVALAALSGLAALLVCGQWTDWRRELGAMLLYGIAVVLFGRILERLFPSSRGICCLLPFLVLASLVFCPVFMDLGQLWPQVRLGGRFLLPTYYLEIF